MEIGKPLRKIVVEPIRDPVPQRAPKPAPEPAPSRPAPARVKTPSGASTAAAEPAGSDSALRKWLPLTILASAQFIMVLDSSVMNVSISQIVADLDTTVTGVQSAITMYTLVMAAFMLVGAKLGDILGRDRAFGLGLAVYGLAR